MKKLLFLSSLILLWTPLFSQCDWSVVFHEDYEHNNVDPGYIQGTAYTSGTPSGYAAKNGQKGLYLNMINSIGLGDTIYNRPLEVCSGFTYNLSVWVCSRWGATPCDVDIDVIDENGNTFYQYSGLLPYYVDGWMQVNTGEFTPTGSIIRLIISTNETNGGSGNDLAMDDIIIEGCNRTIENSMNICPENILDINLFDSISSNNPNGIWLEDSLLGNGYLGTFNLAVNDTGTYNYTIENGVCPDSIQKLDISLKDITIDLGSDTSFCTGQPITLSADLGMDSYTWQDGDTNRTYRVDSEGMYSLTVTKSECVASDSIMVTEIQLPILDLGNDTVGCPGDELVLSPITNADYIEWNDGSTQTSLTVDESEEYYITGSIQQCVSSDTINVIFLTPLSLGNDTTICEDDFFRINLDTTYEDYSWSDGDKKNFKDIFFDGEYYVTVKKWGCTINSDTLKVSRTLFPRIVEPMKDTLICDNSPLILRAYTRYNDGTVWHDFRTDTFNLVNTGGIYWAKAYNECGEVIDSVNVISEDCLCEEYIPNVFTPNGDGLNDLFGYQSNCIPVNHYNMKIYNRWGELLFDSYNYREKWDGKFKGRVCPTGVYSYILQVQYKHDRSKRTISRRIEITL